jgi:hypothetical protein
VHEGEDMPHIAKTLKKLKARKFKPGKVYGIEVAHDKDCPKLHGGPCICEPTVKIVKLTCSEATT